MKKTIATTLVTLTTIAMTAKDNTKRPIYKDPKGFERVSLKAGESKDVSFDITPDKLAFYDINMNRTVESGEFEVMVGGSSEDTDMLKTVFTVE